jgi:type VI secretion system VasD/TssJ family lipoprotein
MNRGNAASVVIYQLSNDVKFRTAPIEEFWRDDEAALGDELVGRRREVLLYPLQVRLLETEIEENANFIAVAANLRNPKTDAWRRIFPTDEVVGERVQVHVAETMLDITVE